MRCGVRRHALRTVRWLAVGVGLLPGCTQGTALPPEASELANMKTANVVPKSTPKSFVDTFERFCLDGPGDTESTMSALRRADYVPASTGATGVHSFVVDDRRPAVLLTDGGCGVTAEARTGQSAAVDAMIARRFPSARPADPAHWGRGVEAGWMLPDAAVVTMSRRPRSDDGAQVLLSIARPA